jgi:hypothetical protein
MALNEQDLLFAVRREPIAHRVVFKVAHDIFGKGFTVEEAAEKPNPAWTREVSKVLDGLNVKAALTQLVVYERLFGWAILAKTYVDYGEDASKPVVDPREVREVLPYGSCSGVQASDEDKDDAAGMVCQFSARCAVLVLTGMASLFKGGSELTRCWITWRLASSALEVLYDDQTVLQMRLGLGELWFAVGGFADITLKAPKQADSEFEDEQNLAQLNARSYFVHDENASTSWVGAAGKALNPEPYLTPVLESASCGADIPQAMLRGANAGALTGSEVNEREYWSGISALQLLHEPTIWALVDALMETGQVSEVEDYQVVWPAGFELTESAKAAIELQLAQARSLKTSWCTVDEVRAEEGKQALPGDAGKVVLGLRKPEPAPAC